MPLRTLLLSCVSADCDQHLWPAHQVIEHNSCIIKNHCTLIPDSERAVFCAGFGGGMDGWGDRSTCACSRLPCTLVTSLLVAVLLAAPPAEPAIGKGLACFRDGAGAGLGGGTQRRGVCFSSQRLRSTSTQQCSVLHCISSLNLSSAPEVAAPCRGKLKPLICLSACGVMGGGIDLMDRPGWCRQKPRDQRRWCVKSWN